MKNILLTLAFLAVVMASYGQGTITFVNGTLTKFKLFDDGVGTAQADIPTSTALNFGVFFGTSSSSLSLNPVTPMATMSTTAGIITVVSGSAYQLPGTNPNDTPFMQVRAWSSSFGSDWAAARAAFDSQSVSGVLYGETAIVQIGPLGASSGPGTVIWQGATGTSPTKFTPLIVHGVPEPSTMALAVLGMASLIFIRRRE